MDKLLENDDSSIESVDFDSILGPTENGEWTDIKDKETVVKYRFYFILWVNQS